jgi:hypothetical protein
MVQHMVVGQYLDPGWVQLAIQGYPGWHSCGSYGWLVYPQTVSEPLLSRVCARMCKRTGLIDWIILTFWLEGQFKFSILYVFTHLNTTFNVGIKVKTTKKGQNEAHFFAAPPPPPHNNNHPPTH